MYCLLRRLLKSEFLSMEKVARSLSINGSHHSPLIYNFFWFWYQCHTHPHQTLAIGSVTYWQYLMLNLNILHLNIRRYSAKKRTYGDGVAFRTYTVAILFFFFFFWVCFFCFFVFFFFCESIIVVFTSLRKSVN